MNNHTAEAIAYVTLFLCITLLTIIFAGSPDLMDAIIKRIKNK